MLQVSPATLRVWRSKRKDEKGNALPERGPRYVKIGGAIRYPVAALEEYAGMELAIPESVNLSRYKTARKKSERENNGG